MMRRGATGATTLFAVVIGAVAGLTSVAFADNPVGAHAALQPVGTAFAGSAANSRTAAADPAFPTVARAHCGPGSSPETGLQGEVPLADQFDGRSQRGYRCNLALVGQYAANGGALMLAWYGHCAYMPTGYAATDPDWNRKKGVIVIDVSNPKHPVETTRLQTPAMINPWEALKANQTRGLLATGEGGSFPLVGPGAAGPHFDVYDVKHDCAHPRLDASGALADAKGHEGDFAPDGKTYYESTLQPAPSKSVLAVDLSNPRHPREISAWADRYGPVHAVQISPDGKRGYFMVAGFYGNRSGPDGLLIADTSQVQSRRPHPQIRIISHLFWTDGDEAQIARYVRIHGHPYLITTDEFGAQASAALACRNGQNPYGFVHIVDIADDRHPKLVNTIRLQVNDPANCATVLPEQTYAPLSLMYSSHYCTPDNPANTTTIACTWISSGLRVFDVRDPRHPREIAYYNPPARLDSNSIRGSAPIFDALVGTRTKDATTTQVRWTHDPETRQPELWFISGENGFQVLKFTNGVYAQSAPRQATGGRMSWGAPGSGTSALARSGEPRRAALTGLATMLVTGLGASLRRRRRVRIA